MQKRRKGADKNMCGHYTRVAQTEDLKASSWVCGVGCGRVARSGNTSGGRVFHCSNVLGKNELA